METGQRAAEDRTMGCWKLDSGLLETGQWTAGNWTVDRWKLGSGLLETGQWTAGDWGGMWTELMAVSRPAASTGRSSLSHSLLRSRRELCSSGVFRNERS